MQADTALRSDTHLTIAEMASLYSVSLRTLRFYEERGLLKPNRAGVQRLYTPQDRVRLEIILTGKRLRFSLREIDAMIHAYTLQKAAEPTHMTAVLDRATTEAQLAALLSQKADIEKTIAELEASLR